MGRRKNPAVLPEFFDTIAELQELSAVAISRRLLPDKYHDITLYVYNDASYSALANVAYFVYLVYRQSSTSPREVCFVLQRLQSLSWAFAETHHHQTVTPSSPFGFASR